MNKMRVNEYDLCDCKLDSNYDLVSLSDLHSNVEFLVSFLNLLKSLCPDLICVAGDIFDTTESNNNELMLKYLKDLSKYCKTYLSIGNHDIMKIVDHKIIVDDNPIILDRLQNETECTLFRDKYNSIQHDENININSINMPYSWYSNGENYEDFKEVALSATSSANPDKFNILLSHSPNSLIIDNSVVSDLEFINMMSLILSGHNHGGITPKVIQNLFNNHFGLVGPYNKYFIKTAYGTWTTNQTSLILNNGMTKFSESCCLGYISKLLNYMFIPDVDLIHLKAGNNHSLTLKNSYVVRV